MSKDFQNIENGISLVIGKPLTWLSYLIWIACCWCFLQTYRFASWLRKRFAKPMEPAKASSRRGKAPALPS